MFLYPSLIVFLGVLSIPVLLVWSRKRNSGANKGYVFLIFGTTVIAMGTLVDFSLDVILGFNLTNRHAFEYAVQFETGLALVFFLPGCVLVGVGLSKWLPAIERLSVEISRREETEKQLIKAKEEAEVANRSKSQFLANMSHELRTPLNAIIGFSELLKSESFGSLGHPNYKIYSTDILASGRHLLGMINDVLDVAKVEVEQLKLAERQFDLSSLVQSCFRMLSIRAQEAGVTLVADLPDKMPGFLGDETRIKQIIVNLVSNAVKFTDKGGTVTVTVLIRADNGLDIIVKDTGIGIAEEDIPLILKSFGQVQNSYTRNTEGTGLGLTLVQILAKVHDATFTLESEVDVGTICTVQFPPERTMMYTEIKQTM